MTSATVHVGAAAMRPHPPFTVRVRALRLAVPLAAALASLVPPSPFASAAEPAVAATADARSTAAPTLKGQIDLLLEAPILADATVGIHVVDLETGNVLYERGPEQPLNPASNVKLLTTAAALVVLGPEHRYATRILRNDGALSGSVVKGDIYLVGSGDPNLVTEDLAALASELHARGIRRITGGIVVDSSRFDRDELPPGFDQKDELASYRAPSSATSVNFNTFLVRASPGAKAGDAALVGLDPAVGGIALTNTATTVPGRGRKLFADVESAGSGMKIEIRGTIGEDASSGRYRYPIADPSRNAGEVLLHVLKKQGIKVGRRKVKVGSTPKKARSLATHFSAPLSAQIRSVNKFSNNFMAEQILKTLSPTDTPASFAAASAREREALTSLGVNLDGARLTNGSGLYDTNRVSPSQVTSLLTAMVGDFRYRADFLASLAVMGVDGTTRSRLQNSDATGWVRVKTGTLDGISALSGYVGARGRKPIVFSLLFNDLPGGATSSARDVQNEVALMLSRYASGRPLRPADASVANGP
ncbi:MAG: D-alanyl-D-alanine carboxypeptidase/D-alanyl-D-alanine endopeptidase [Nannocystales bacterium]